MSFLKKRNTGQRERERGSWGIFLTSRGADNGASTINLPEDSSARSAVPPFSLIPPLFFCLLLIFLSFVCSEEVWYILYKIPNAGAAATTAGFRSGVRPALELLRAICLDQRRCETSTSSTSSVIVYTSSGGDLRTLKTYSPFFHIYLYTRVFFNDGRSYETVEQLKRRKKNTHIQTILCFIVWALHKLKYRRIQGEIRPSLRPFIRQPQRSSLRLSMWQPYN